MINTFNESSLHKTLKTIYSLKEGSKTEEKVGQWICDIVCKNNEIIEIQTANVSSLREKVENLLKTGHKITIVHPIIVCKTIQTYDTNDKLISKRKSPKKESIYSIFRQLTGLTDFLLNKDFTLEVPEITLIEYRKKTAIPVQTQNKKRRFLRDWIKTDKKLSEILCTHTFNNATDFLNLIPQFTDGSISAKNDITVKETATLIKKNYSAQAAAQTSVMFWVLKKAKMIELDHKKGNENHYKI